MGKRKAMGKRIAALEATVREQRNRLDGVVHRLNVTQDLQVARVFERYPDMLADLPRLN